MEKFFSKTTRMLQVIVLLKPPVITKHCVNFQNVIFKDFDVKFRIHYLAKVKQTCLSVIQNLPHAKIFALSLSIGQIGRTFLCQRFTVFQMSWKAISSSVSK